MKKLFDIQKYYENANEQLEVSLMHNSFINGSEYKVLAEKLDQYIGNLKTYEDLYRIILLIRKVFSDLEEYQLKIHMDSEEISYIVEYKVQKLLFFSYHYMGEDDSYSTIFCRNGFLIPNFSVKHKPRGYLLGDCLVNLIQILWQEIKKVYLLNQLSTINLEEISLEKLLMEENNSSFIHKRHL